MLDRHHAPLEEPLASACEHDGLSIGFPQCRVILDPAQFVFLPLHESDRRSHRHLFSDAVAQNQIARLGAKQIDQRRCESVGQAGQVDALQARTIGTQRCVSLRQQRRQHGHVL